MIFICIVDESADLHWSRGNLQLQRTDAEIQMKERQWNWCNLIHMLDFIKSGNTLEIKLLFVPPWTDSFHQGRLAWTPEI